MSLLSLILAFLLEQLRPLDAGRWVRAPLSRISGFMEGRFNDGDARHGMIAWLLVALPLVLGVGVLYFLLHRINPLLALAFDVAVLYLTMGFRQSSHYFTDIHLALRMGELDRARQQLAEWRGENADRLGSSEVARLAIEQALLSSHRHVFAPLFWFAVVGPAGALLYRLALFLKDEWDGRGRTEEGAFGDFARQAFTAIDWLPVRLTAAAFAVVGDFEDAVFCWRSQAGRWPDPAAGILLASGGGALGVRLGMPVHVETDPAERPEMGTGDEADADFMQSTIGLVWRTVVLVLLLLVLVGVAGWVS